MDETAYLTRNKNNKKFLEKSLEQIENGKVVEVDVDKLKKCVQARINSKDVNIANLT